MMPPRPPPPAWLANFQVMLMALGAIYYLLKRDIHRVLIAYRKRQRVKYLMKRYARKRPARKAMRRVY